jgi:hypothetical protein
MPTLFTMVKHAVNTEKGLLSTLITHTHGEKGVCCTSVSLFIVLQVTTKLNFPCRWARVSMKLAVMAISLLYYTSECWGPA